MRTRLTLWIALTLVLGVLPTVAVGSNVDVSTTGVSVLRVPGGQGSAVAINSSGWIATSTAVWQGVGYPTDLWPELTALDPGAGFLAVTDLNDGGEVVGSFSNAGDRSFHWTTSGMQLLGLRTANGIDADGRIVGTLLSGFSFIGTPGGFTQIIEPSAFLQAQAIDNGLVVGAGTYKTATGITPLQGNGVGYDSNSSETIVGHLTIGGGVIEATSWTGPTGAPTQLGFLPGDTVSQARAINDLGWIVGWSGTSTNPTVARRAFLWRPGVGMTDLGLFPGDASAEAFDIDAVGVIVGRSGNAPVIWDMSGSFSVDYPPEVAFSGAWSVTAGDLLDESIMITDEEGDPFTAVWTGLPAGASWDGTSELTWQTDLGDVGTYPVSLTVTQDSLPANTITLDGVITVNATSLALEPIGDQTGEVGAETTFVATASPSVPENPVTFSLTTPTATGAVIHPSTGAFAWTPAAGQVGLHSITITVTEQVCDPRSCGDPFITDSEVITVTVTGPDLPPVLTPIVETVDEFDTLALPRSTFLSDPDTPLGDITLTLEAGDDPVPAGATVGNSLVWVPGELDGGTTVQFVIRAADTATPPNETTTTVTLTIIETNEAPVADLIPPVAALVGQAVNLTVTATDTDVPVDTLGFSVLFGPGLIDALTGEFSFTPSVVGQTTSVIEVSDGVAGAIVEIDVNALLADNAPIAVDDSYSVSEDGVLTVGTPGVLSNDTDPDSDPLTASEVTPPVNGTLLLNTDGSFVYTPDPDWSGVDGFVYTASDGPNSVQATVVITVATQNDAPTIEPIADQFVFEGQTLTVTPVYSDVDGDALDHTWSGLLPSNAVLNGIFVLPSVEGQGGLGFDVTLTVTDGDGLEAQETFSVTVIQTNQAPTVEDPDSQQVFTGDTVTFSVGASDPDIPANVLTFSLDGAPAGAVIDPATGDFVWPNATTGAHTFDVVVEDDWVVPLEDRASMTILVIDPTLLPNDLGVDLSLESGDPDGDAIVDLGLILHFRAHITETNLGASDTSVVFTFPGDITLLGTPGSDCDLFVVAGTGTLVACYVGSFTGSVDVDIVVSLDESLVYPITAEVTSGNVETNTANNTDELVIESRLTIRVFESIGASDNPVVIPPLTVGTVFEDLGVADVSTVVPPLNVGTIFETLGVVDLPTVVPPLSLATIFEGIGVLDGLTVIHDSDGNGIPDIPGALLNPDNGEIVVEAAPGSTVLMGGGGLLPGSPVVVILHSEPVLLAEVTADENGEVWLILTIPADTEPGSHRIVMTGTWASGGPVEYVFPLEVTGLCTIYGTEGNDVI